MRIWQKDPKKIIFGGDLIATHPHDMTRACCRQNNVRGRNRNDPEKKAILLDDFEFIDFGVHSIRVLNKPFHFCVRNRSREVAGIFPGITRNE